jgi:hypothetical protein
MHGGYPCTGGYPWTGGDTFFGIGKVRACMVDIHGRWGYILWERLGSEHAWSISIYHGYPLTGGDTGYITLTQ